MELRAYCEQVLLSESMAEKLVEPDHLSDTTPGPAVAKIDAPGRPEHLRLDRQLGREAFPALRQLDDVQHHRAALHAFMNHELLALELMAVVLLRFPDAPPDYRLGLGKIMLEERMHCRLYEQRLAALGGRFGDHPVSAHFWDCLHDPRSPQDAAAGMNLTLEQANLDYAATYARAFSAVGAPETARVLQRVLADEIRHVKFGVEWFQRWLEPGADLFDAHAAALTLPLSLARARGHELNREARLAAGLSPDYVARIAAYRGSRGRPPTVYLFNPHCEQEVADGAHAQAPEIVDRLTRDLGTLPGLLATAQDVVVVTKTPADAHLRTLDDLDLARPGFVQTVPGAETAPHVSDLQPWGWSPSAWARLRSLGPRVVHPPRFYYAAGDEGLPRWWHRDLHGKSRALPVLRRVREAIDCDWLHTPAVEGQRHESVAATMASIAQFIAAGFHTVVIKAEYGSSGRGMIRIGEDERVGTGNGQAMTLRSPARVWLERALATQGAVVVEPWLDRRCDLSLRMIIDRPGDGRMLSLGHAEVDRRGQFRGAYVGRWTQSLSEPMRRFVHGEGRDRKRFERVIARVADEVAAELRPTGYTGRVGVDAMIYADGDRLRLKPVVEINPRITMGHLAHALHRVVPSGACGLFAVLGPSDRRAYGAQDLAACVRALQARAPPKIEAGRLREGVLALTELHEDTCFAAVLAVASDADGARERVWPSRP